jgi:hypothetical protein
MHLLVKNIQHLHYLWLEFPPVSVSVLNIYFLCRKSKPLLQPNPKQKFQHHKQQELCIPQMQGAMYKHPQLWVSPTDTRKNFQSSLGKFMVLVEIKVATFQWKYVHKEIGIIFWP